MKLGVISDTHGNVRATLDGIRVLSSLEVAAVVHCGDIGSAAITDLFESWPTHFVFGNVDYERAMLEQAIRSAGHTCHGILGRIELGGRQIAFTHGDQPNLLADVIHDGLADLVCYGHTHQAEWHDEGPTRVLNPGALHRANPHTVAVVELPTLTIHIVPVH